MKYPPIQITPESNKYACVTLVQREDGKILCVWNRKYGGFVMPGGKVEEGESLVRAQERELYEEAGLTSKGDGIPIYTAPSSIANTRQVIVWQCSYLGTPKQMEDNCPIIWLTPEELIRWSNFSQFYVDMFAYLKGLAP